MLKPEPNQLDEFKMQKLADTDVENFGDHHSVLSNNSNISGMSAPAASPSPGAVMAATATGKPANPNRRLRHQGFSKNIYIGTRNAERWDLVRTGLKFKNDVEFVSFLLRLAESGHGAMFMEETKHIDEENSENENPSVMHNKNNANTENGEKETNNNVGAKTKKRNQNNRRNKISLKNNNNNNNTSDSSNGNISNNNNENVQPTMRPLSEKPAKVAKKVKFHDDVKIIERIEDNEDESCGAEQYQHGLGAATTLQFPQEAQDHSISSTIDGSISEDSDSVGVLDCRIEEKIKIELEEKKKLERQSIFDEQLPSTSSLTTDVKLPPPGTPNPPRMPSDFEDDDDDDDDRDEDVTEEKFTVPNPELDPSLFSMDCESLIKVARIPDPSVKIKPDPGVEVGGESVAPPVLNPADVPKKKRTINRKRQCCSCNTKHGKDQCPLKTPVGELSDKITLDEWLDNAKKLAAEYLERQKLLLAKSPLDFDEDDADDENGDMTAEMKLQAKERETFEETKNFLSKLPSYSELSLPEEFEFQPSAHPMHGQSVFAKTPIPKFTKLGPVIGNQVTETDINDDCPMRYVFEIYDGTKSTYFSVENKNQSNWLRYIRPARVRDEKNVSLCSFDEEIYFVTCRDLEVGSELLYWSDEHNSSWDKKKMDKASKTNCGGCNLKFDHPLYYRTHCSVFHDSAFSLTIRKYHCKICGISVLGKDSIMKHAEQMHDGKGAYQCQFCKKFFLRLNYLEMHRTYGCSANPQRARPLCDFCGRKFCQPQKLKVHIKRMHSDMAEVLRDFQCKLCSKLLGSRAALQRHSKEVHSRNSAVVSCPRCQKLFQNRSNLKIHMLTHSGVRPFKCAENECSAAFTTKQCLQFHYKKVHGYTQDRMPKIERSVAYTFDAYAGGDPIDDEDETKGSGGGAIKRLRPGKSHRESISKILKSDYFFKKQFKDNILKNKEIISAFSSNSASCDSDNVAMALLSNKISSIINSQQELSNCSTQQDFDMDDDDEDEDEMEHGGHFPMTESTSDCECGGMEGGELSDKCFKHNGASLKALMTGAHISNNEEFISRDNLFSRHSTNGASRSSQGDANLMMPSETMTDGTLSANRSLKELILASNANLLISKGSKKLMNDEGEQQQQANAAANDDCLSNFLSNVARDASDKSSNADDSNVKERPDIGDEIDDEDDEEEDDQQQHEQRTNDDEMLDVPDDVGQKMEDGEEQHRTNFNESMDHMAQLQQHFPNQMTNSFASSFNQNLLGNYYNNCPSTNNRLSSTSALSTSASLLVEAALNSVSNMIDNEDMANAADSQQQQQQNQQQQNNESPPTMDLNMANGAHQAQAMNMDMVENFSDDNHDSNIDTNEKMMKSQGYPMHSPFIDSFANQMVTNPMSQQHEANNEIDVDSATPKHLDSGGRQEKMNGYGTNGGHIYASYDNSHQPSPVPPPAMTPDYAGDYCNPGSQQQMRQGSGTPMSSISRKHKIYSDHDMNSPASTVSPLPTYGRDKSLEQQIGASYGGGCEGKDTNMQQQQQRRQHMSSDEESSVVIPENLSVEHAGANSHLIEDGGEDDKLKMSQQMDFLYGGKFDNNGLNHRMAELPDLRLKYNNQSNMDALADYRQGSNPPSNGMDDMNGAGSSDFQGIDMTSRSGISGYHHNLHAPAAASNFNRYHHHIFDILGDREADQHQQQQQHEHHGYSLPPPPPPSVASTPPQQHHSHMQHMQHLIDDHLEPANHQATVDLSRTSSYLMASPPPSATASSSISYSHSHSDMLRMVSLDLSSSSGGGMTGAAATHVRHHSSYISSHLPQTSRDALSEHQQRLLSAEQLTTNHRLLLDPAHLLLEQNNRLLSGENSRLLDQSRLMDNNHRHMSAASHRGFYHHHHHHHQITSNYHHSKQIGSAASQISQHNYHSFPSYY